MVDAKVDTKNCCLSTSVVMLILVFGPLSGMKVEDSSLDGELKKKLL